MGSEEAGGGVDGSFGGWEWRRCGSWGSEKEGHVVLGGDGKSIGVGQEGGLFSLDRRDTASPDAPTECFFLAVRRYTR